MFGDRTTTRGAFKLQTMGTTHGTFKVKVMSRLTRRIVPGFTLEYQEEPTAQAIIADLKRMIEII